MVDGLVSVIMPSWNTAEFIEDSINSVLNQTYSNLELIIVDDCSSDKTDYIISKYQDPRIRYYKNEKNLGAALTRNRALKEAKGEWIAFLDSDDIWFKEKLSKQIEFMKTNNYDLCYSEYEKISESGEPLGIFVSGPDVVTTRRIYQYDYIGQLTMIYSFKKYGLIQIKDISKNNDYAIRLKLYRYPNTKAYLLKENLAQYRVRKKSVSHDKFLKKIKSHYELFRTCDDRSRVNSVYLTVQNLIFGFIKKIEFEKTK